MPIITKYKSILIFKYEQHTILERKKNVDITQLNLKNPITLPQNMMKVISQINTRAYLYAKGTEY